MSGKDGFVFADKKDVTTCNNCKKIVAPDLVHIPLIPGSLCTIRDMDGKPAHQAGSAEIADALMILRKEILGIAISTSNNSTPQALLNIQTTTLGVIQSLITIIQEASVDLLRIKST